MTPIMPTIKMMTYEEADEKGLLNRGLVLEHEGRSYYLNAGLKDKIHVFSRSIYILVLTINFPLGYIGLDAYMPNEKEPLNSIFLHSEYQITEYLGRYWRSMSPITLATRLVDYLI